MTSLWRYAFFLREKVRFDARKKSYQSPSVQKNPLASSRKIRRTTINQRLTLSSFAYCKQLTYCSAPSARSGMSRVANCASMATRTQACTAFPVQTSHGWQEIAINAKRLTSNNRQILLKLSFLAQVQRKSCCCGRALYSEGAGFDSPSELQITWVSRYSLNHFRQMQATKSRLRHIDFL